MWPPKYYGLSEISLLQIIVLVLSVFLAVITSLDFFGSWQKRIVIFTASALLLAAIVLNYCIDKEQIKTNLERETDLQFIQTLLEPVNGLTVKLKRNPMVAPHDLPISLQFQMRHSILGQSKTSMVKEVVLLYQSDSGWTINSNALRSELKGMNLEIDTIQHTCSFFIPDLSISPVVGSEWNPVNVAALGEIDWEITCHLLEYQNITRFDSTNWPWWPVNWIEIYINKEDLENRIMIAGPATVPDQSTVIAYVPWDYPDSPDALVDYETKQFVFRWSPRSLREAIHEKLFGEKWHPPKM